MPDLFQNLLVDLQHEHTRQLGELHHEVSSLKQELTRYQGDAEAHRCDSNDDHQMAAAPSACHAPSVRFAAPTRDHTNSIEATQSTRSVRFDAGSMPATSTYVSRMENIAHSASSNVNRMESMGPSASSNVNRMENMASCISVVNDNASARKVMRSGHEITMGSTVAHSATVEDLDTIQGKGRCSLPRCSSPKQILQWHLFEATVAILIVMCALCNALELQFLGMKRGHALNIAGYGHREDLWGTGVDVLSAVDVAFSAMFTLEFLFRVFALRCRVFRSLWNWLDAIVVVSSVLDLALGSGHSANGKSLRLFRIVKVARLLKALKVYVAFLNILQLLVASIIASFSILFWIMIVLMGVQMICALIITQLLEPVYDDDGISEAGKQSVFLYFGTFSRSLISVFEILLANYAKPCRVLVETVGEQYGIIVIAYRCVCGFSVLSMVQAIFLQQSMKLMTQDTEVMLRDKAEMEKKYIINIENLFSSLDMGGDGIVTWSEFQATFHNDNVRIYCHELGLDPHDLEDIYHLVDDGEGVSCDDFIEAAKQIRKQARTIDMARVLANGFKIRKNLQSLHKVVLQNLNSRDVSSTHQRGHCTVDASTMTDQQLCAHVVDPMTEGLPTRL